MAEERECLNCGKKFIPICHITRQKYRSEARRYRYNNAKRHYEVPVNICSARRDAVEQKIAGRDDGGGSAEISAGWRIFEINVEKKSEPAFTGSQKIRGIWGDGAEYPA